MWVPIPFPSSTIAFPEDVAVFIKATLCDCDVHDKLTLCQGEDSHVSGS
jgi:hypothetical protein